MIAVITTAKRGVFCGEVPDDTMPGSGAVTIQNARMCVYWSADVRGVIGLAASGPTQMCRIGPVVPEIRVSEVTAVIKCTPEAVCAWEKAPWR